MLLRQRPEVQAVLRRLRAGPRRAGTRVPANENALARRRGGDIYRRGVWKQERGTMHTTREKEKLIARVRRIRGQVEAVEKAIANEEDCSKVLTTVAACRGALTALTAEILEDHIRFHVMDPEAKANSKRTLAGEELIDVVRAFLK